MPDLELHPATDRVRRIGVGLALWLAWTWTFAAGGGGLWLLVTKGPWPLTNGWYALASGIAACPLTAWLARRATGVTFPGWLRFAAAAFFFVAGHIALELQAR